MRKSEIKNDKNKNEILNDQKNIDRKVIKKSVLIEKHNFNDLIDNESSNKTKVNKRGSISYLKYKPIINHDEASIVSNLKTDKNETSNTKAKYLKKLNDSNMKIQNKQSTINSSNNTKYQKKIKISNDSNKIQKNKDNKSKNTEINKANSNLNLKSQSINSSIKKLNKNTNKNFNILPFSKSETDFTRNLSVSNEFQKKLEEEIEFLKNRKKQKFERNKEKEMKLVEFNKCISDKINPIKDNKKKITVNEIPLILADRFESKKHELEKQLNMLKEKMGLIKKSKTSQSEKKTKTKVKKIIRPSIILNDKKLGDKFNKINEKLADTTNNNAYVKQINSKTTELKNINKKVNVNKSLSNRN